MCLLLEPTSGRFSRSVKDPERLTEEARRKEVKESRIMTPSRVMLPPHTPHFIYFNPSDQLTPVREEEGREDDPVNFVDAAIFRRLGGSNGGDTDNGVTPDR